MQTGFQADRPLGYQQVTALTSAVGLTVPAVVSAGYPACSRVLLQAEAQNIRWRDDGTNPTASVGMILIAGGAPVEYVGNPALLRFIEATATAKLNVTYYG